MHFDQVERLLTDAVLAIIADHRGLELEKTNAYPSLEAFGYGLNFFACSPFFWLDRYGWHKHIM